MPKKLRVGVVGVGGIAAVHFPGWLESPHTEMVAFADVEREPLERRGREFGVTRLYDDPYDLVRDPEIDIVDLCVPNMFHRPLGVAALNAGKHVLCEKPLAPTPADIQKLIQARDRSGKMLMTAQHFRFTASAQALRKAVDTGVLGEVYHARSWMLRRSGAPTRPGFIHRANSGGGPCIDIGVHILDLTLWMMGYPKPVAVSGVTQARLAKQPDAFSDWGGPVPKSFDVEEMAAAMVRFDNGATLVLEVAWLLHHKTPSEDMQMWLYGDRGGVHWPSNEILTTDLKRQQHMNTTLEVRQTLPPHTLECMAFAEAVVNKTPSPVPAEQSLEVIRILDGLYRSASRGKEVRL